MGEQEHLTANDAATKLAEMIVASDNPNPDQLRIARKWLGYDEKVICDCPGCGRQEFCSEGLAPPGLEFPEVCAVCGNPDATYSHPRKEPSDGHD